VSMILDFMISFLVLKVLFYDLEAEIGVLLNLLLISLFCFRAVCHCRL